MWVVFLVTVGKEQLELARVGSLLGVEVKGVLVSWLRPDNYLGMTNTVHMGVRAMAG